MGGIIAAISGKNLVSVMTVSTDCFNIVMNIYVLIQTLLQLVVSI